MSASRRDTVLSYDDRLAKVASWYRDHGDPEEGGWPMHWGETPGSRRASLIGTAYGLAIVRYARAPITADHVQRALRFALDENRTWSGTRHPVYMIHAATEWPETLIEGGMGPQALVSAAHVHERIDAALDWLTRNRNGNGWPAFPDGGHLCLPWTAKVLYALGRVRERGDPYRANEELTAMIRDAADTLLEHQLPGDSAGEGAWPFCGEPTLPSIATTALIVIALSHRNVESAGTPHQQQRWRDAYQAGAGWLLDHHQDWEENEHGEHDPELDDNWQFAVWSLAPRACLSAGTDPSHPQLARGLRFAFDRWRSARHPAWYIRGHGVSGYSNWSVVQLGQALKLAISRLDPLRVHRALLQGPTGLETSSDVTVLLDPASRTMELVRANGRRKIASLARQEKRFKLLSAFAEREVPAGGALDSTTLQQWVNDSNGKNVTKPWQALKALAHQINETARTSLNDPTVQLLRATTRRDQKVIVTIARCTLKTPETAPQDTTTEDVTGISAATGESY